MITLYVLRNKIILIGVHDSYRKVKQICALSLVYALDMTYLLNVTFIYFSDEQKQKDAEAAAHFHIKAAVYIFNVTKSAKYSKER